MYIVTSEAITEDQNLDSKPRCMAITRAGLQGLEESGSNLRDHNSRILRNMTELLDEMFPASESDSKMQKSELKEEMRLSSH